MTQEEKEFLVNILNQITVKGADPASVRTVELIQSILNKLKE